MVKAVRGSEIGKGEFPRISPDVRKAIVKQKRRFLR